MANTFLTSVPGYPLQSPKAFGGFPLLSLSRAL